MYKLLAIDMDGTLLNSNREVSKENKDAIKKAIENGVRVVITSGRSLKGLEKFLEEMNLRGENQYLIANNGGTIYKTDDFKCINYKGLTSEDLIESYKLSLNTGLQMMAYTHNDCIAPEENEFTKFEREFVGTKVKIIDCNTVNDEITKILFSQKEENLEKIMKEIPMEYYDKYHVVKTMPKVLEVMNKECNKGYGVKKLADYLGINRDEIICIGDEANDVEMIEYAGLGVAMGNAIDEVKSLANYVTDSNDNNGVAKVIEKFIL